MKHKASILIGWFISLLLCLTNVFAEEKFTLSAKGKPLQAIVYELALEHDIEFKNSSVVSREILDIEMTDTVNNMFSRLLKGYNHIVSSDKDGRIRSVTVFSPRLADSSFDESILPTGELMPDEN
jgi:hypothetical protein